MTAQALKVHLSNSPAHTYHEQELCDFYTWSLLEQTEYHHCWLRVSASLSRWNLFYGEPVAEWPELQLPSLYVRTSGMRILWCVLTSKCKLIPQRICRSMKGPILLVGHGECVILTTHNQSTLISWQDNTYPGCGSDIPCHWYSFSQEPNPDWKSYYANQPEIREYLEGVFKKHNLQKYLVNSTNVEYARWDNELKGYELTLVNTKTGEKTSAFTEILISAIGGFISPVHPKDLFGKDVFTGHIWHSSRWNHEVSLSGKSVGVIGNGCSAWVCCFVWLCQWLVTADFQCANCSSDFSG